MVSSEDHPNKNPASEVCGTALATWELLKFFFFFPGDRMDILDELPSGYVKIAIENDHL